MAWYKELIGDALEAYNKATNVVFETAQLELGMTPDKLVIRDLRFADLGHTMGAAVQNGTNWHFVGTGAGTISNWVNVEVADTRFFNIYGVAPQPFRKVSGTSDVSQDTAILEEVRATRGGKLLRIWPMRHLINDFGGDARVWFTDDPVTVSQNITLQLDVVHSIIGTFDLVFLGRVVEPDAKTINK